MAIDSPELVAHENVRLIRRGDRRAAWLIGGSLGAYSLSLFMIIPVDMALILLPSLHTFAFLLIVALRRHADRRGELLRATGIAAAFALYGKEGRNHV